MRGSERKDCRGDLALSFAIASGMHRSIHYVFFWPIMQIQRYLHRKVFSSSFPVYLGTLYITHFVK